MSDTPFEDFLSSLDYSGIDGDALDLPDEALEQRDRIARIEALFADGKLKTLKGSSDGDRAAWEFSAAETIRLLQKKHQPHRFDEHGAHYLFGIDELYILCVTAVTLNRLEVDPTAVDLAADSACIYLRQSGAAAETLERGDKLLCTLPMLKTLMAQANYIYTELMRPADL